MAMKRNRLRQVMTAGPSVSGFRPEIQGLRALAVILVVAYHVAPDRAPGGYVGVDVFFVISGFLIGSHLISEVQQTGSIRLLRFWIRRVRRLLPASLLVLAVSLVLTMTVLPASVRLENLREIGASTLYLQNWLLANNAVDYLAASNTPTLVQHFWSLSTEEQFYIAWPLLILASLAVVRRRAAVGVMLAVIVVASFAASAILVSTSPGDAYFVTYARAWEFAAGGLLAFVPASGRRVGRSVLGWAGLAMISTAVLMYGDATPFPGAAALLPVVGTMAVIAAGDPPTRFSPVAFARLRPVQYLGAISYSVYLWHFPLLQTYAGLHGHPAHGVAAVAIVVATLGLAALTKRFVEDRFRRPAPLRRGNWRTVLTTGVAMATLVAATSGASLYVDEQNGRAADLALARITHGDPCYSLSATDPAHRCADPFGLPADLDTAAVASDSTHSWCLEPYVGVAVKTCRFGDTEHPSRRIALLGDSHANVLVDGLATVGSARHWQITTYLKEGCPAVPAKPLAGHLTRRDAVDCSTWSGRAVDAIEADRSIDTVLFTNASNARGYYRGISEQQYEALFARLIRSGKRVVVMFDVPKPAEAGPRCIDAWQRTGRECSSSLALATRAGAPLRDAARSVPGVDVVDPTRFFCDAECHVVIGGVGAYFDIDHITVTVSLSLAPVLENALRHVPTAG